MVRFPLKFQVKASATAPMNAHWQGDASSLPPIEMAIPPEFNGPGGGYSPEDLFGLALLSCLIAMYKVYCAKSNISFASIEANAELTADKDPSLASFHISQIDLTLRVKGSSDRQKGRQLLEEAIKHCPIGNSIKSSKTFHLEVQ